MSLPSRSDVEGMAFKALMGSIGINNLPCDCPSCTKKSRPAPRQQPSRRKASDKETTEPAQSTDHATSTCGHHHHHHHHHHGAESRPTLGSRKESGTLTTQARASQSPSNTPGRNDKINSLLKAETTAAIFDVFNATSTTNEEKELVAQIQHVTQDCKTYPDSKAQIMKLCDNDKIGTGAFPGLLAKFRHERNLLTTAILKSNTEREKALLCIKRVDDLMYMLSDVSKRPKDTPNDGLMASLGEIIMEVHEIAKHPSILYEELLDIRDDHLQLLDDHDDMHQKFIDVNSCHDRLHANHEKLQSTHTKLMADHVEAKKKAATVNGLKQDLSRLEKAVDKKQDENTELKKEIEKLNTEMAKVNALKHEVAQLKKKVATLSAQPVTEEAVSQPSTATRSAPLSSAMQASNAKKKKGKKGVPLAPPSAESDATEKAQAESSYDNKPSDDKNMLKLQQSYEAVVKELALLRDNLAQIDKLRQKAEGARDQAIEQLQLEQATSQNWQQISDSHAEGKAKLEGQLDHCKNVIENLQWTAKKQETSLFEATRDLSRQKLAHEQARAELQTRSRTPAMSETDKPASFPEGPLKLLQKFKAETKQLMRDVEDCMAYNIDLHSLLKMIQSAVQRMNTETEKEIEALMGDNDTMRYHSLPEATFPPALPGNNQMRNPKHHMFEQYDHSPRASPSMHYSLVHGSSSIQSHRPSIPPGFREPSPTASSMHSFNRATDSPLMNTSLNNQPTPASTLSMLTGSPSQAYANSTNTNSDFGPIGSRIPSSSMQQAVASAKNADVRRGKTPPPAPATVLAPGLSPHAGGLGNGAHGMDWSRWSRGPK